MDRPTNRAGDGRRARPAAHELARYEALFAARTRGMKSSAMREMMALTERPDVISLAGGPPGHHDLSAGAVRQADVAGGGRVHRAGACSTARPRGWPRRCECIVEVMEEEGTVVDPAEVIVTTGGQQVIDLVCKALIDPGDVIVAEAPTYPGAVPTFGAYQADVVQIEMDADGMPIDELESTLDRLAAEGRRPKFIYTIPNFQNPGGVTMSLARRHRLVEVARERELLVLEDNPYGLLRYEGEPLPTLYSLDAAAVGRGGASDLVIYLGTFSKILSPGLAPGLGRRPQARAREAEPRQTGRGPVLLAGHPAVRRGVLQGGRLARVHRAAAGSCTAAGATSCWRRSSSTSAGRRPGPSRRAACSSGRRSTAGSTPPTCSRTARAWRSCPGAPRTWMDAAVRHRCA